MTAAEQHLLLVAQAWILASIPLALLAFQVWFPKPQPTPAAQPVIPHEDETPAGSFLDVSLPPPDRLPEEKGVPVRHWKRVDGWVALALVAVLIGLMGPSLVTPEQTPELPISPEKWVIQLTFQFGFAGLLLYYLGVLRQFNLVKFFGLSRHRLLGHVAWACAFILPGFLLIIWAAGLLLPPLMQALGLDNPSRQLMVEALQNRPPDLIVALMEISGCIAAPVMEELIFRGFLYGVAKRFTHTSYAAISSALLFGLIHTNVMGFLPLTILGLLFVWAYEVTRSLLVPIFMHGIFNLLNMGILFYGPELAKYADKAG